MSSELPDEDEHTDYGEAVGRSFVDKFLLSIIDAYPDPGPASASTAKRRMDRLRDAKQALFGQPNPEGRPRDSDEAALRWIVSEAYNDCARVDWAKLKGKELPKPRSVRDLVREAVKRFGLLENADERLRKKFSGDVAKK